MLRMHLRQPGFTCSSCRPFSKNKERIEKFKETGDSRHIYQNELDKACFQHDMAYGDFKGLPKRHIYMRKYLVLLKIQNMLDIIMVLLQWFINFLIKSLCVVLLHVHGQRP